MLSNGRTRSEGRMINNIFLKKSECKIDKVIQRVMRYKIKSRWNVLLKQKKTTSV